MYSVIDVLVYYMPEGSSTLSHNVLVLQLCTVPFWSHQLICWLVTLTLMPDEVLTLLHIFWLLTALFPPFGILWQWVLKWVAFDYTITALVIEQSYDVHCIHIKRCVKEHIVVFKITFYFAYTDLPILPTISNFSVSDSFRLCTLCHIILLLLLQ